MTFAIRSSVFFLHFSDFPIVSRDQKSAAQTNRSSPVDTASNLLYLMLAHDDTARTEIAHEAVAFCARWVADKQTWLRHIDRDALLGNHLKTIFEALKMLCEVHMDDGPLPSPSTAWHQWKLQTGLGATTGTIARLLSELAVVGSG